MNDNLYFVDPAGRKLLIASFDQLTHTAWKHTKPEHFCIKYQGFGIQKGALETLKKEGIVDFIVHYHGKSEIDYCTTVDNWIKNGEEDDLGAGAQIFLRDRFWSKIKL